MKSFKKRIKDEFNNHSPSLRREVFDAPICVDVNSEVYQNNGTIAKRRNCIIISMLAVLMAVSFSLMYVFGVFSGKGKADKYVFTLEINPAVSFITDSYGVVTDVKALNDDADVILCSDEVIAELKNVPLSEALVIYTDYAVQLGYIDAQSTQNAVRISYTEQTEAQLKQIAVNGLEKYFKEKGIVSVVAFEELDVDKLAERNGVEGTGDVEQLVEELKKFPDHFVARNVGGKLPEEIKAIYEEKIISAHVFDKVKQQLLDCADRIADNVEKLVEIYSLQSEIVVHQDNPYFIPVDYWTLKENYNGHYTPEFDNLMQTMQRLLDNYHRDFGVLINSIGDLSRVYNVYSALLNVEVEEVFAGLEVEDFIDESQNFVEILKNVGCNTEGLTELLSVPETAEEYFEKSKAMLNQMHKDRKEQNKDAYGQEREQISDEDYRENANSIEKEYGSLSDYFEQIKKKSKNKINFLQ